MSLAAYRLGATSSELTISRSRSESDRFGFEIGRVEIPIGASYSAKEIRWTAERSGLDIVIVRYSAQHPDWFAGLLSSRYTAIHADTLMYFEKSIGEPVVPGPLDARPVVTDQDAEILQSLAASSFHEYKSHYFANPLLDQGTIADGYAEWAMSYRRSQDSGRDAFLARTAEGQVAGFAAVSYESVPEFALVAVAPTMSGHGLYGDILEAVEVLLAKRGAQGCVISTQVHNLAVIRTVTKRGYRPVLSLQTVHLVRNDLLAHA